MNANKIKKIAFISIIIFCIIVIGVYSYFFRRRGS